MEQETIHKPVKSILVTESGEESGRRSGRRRSVRWDEETIESHDKERGQTMKINEPKTPYVDSLSDEDLKEMNEEKPDPVDDVTKENTIKNKHVGDHLDVESLNSKIIEKSEAWDKEQKLQEEEEKEKEQKHNAFVEKRKHHYDEGKMMKALLKNNWNENDEQDQS